MDSASTRRPSTSLPKDNKKLNNNNKKNGT